MTRDTFVVRTDADTGLKYVVKRKDELTVQIQNGTTMLPLGKKTLKG